MNAVDTVLFTKLHLNDVVTSALEILKILWKRMEQHLQDVAQNFLNYNNS